MSTGPLIKLCSFLNWIFGLFLSYSSHDFCSNVFGFLSLKYSASINVLEQITNDRKGEARFEEFFHVSAANLGPSYFLLL